MVAHDCLCLFVTVYSVVSPSGLLPHSLCSCVWTHSNVSYMLSVCIGYVTARCACVMVCACVACVVVWVSSAVVAAVVGRISKQILLCRWDCIRTVQLCRSGECTQHTHTHTLHTHTLHTDRQDTHTHTHAHTHTRTRTHTRTETGAMCVGAHMVSLCCGCACRSRKPRLIRCQQKWAHADPPPLHASHAYSYLSLLFAFFCPHV